MLFKIAVFLSYFYLHSCLPLFFSSYLPITSLLPIFLPSYPPDHHFHSPTESPTAPTSQPSNHQATVEEVTSLYSFHMECGAFTMTPKEPCHGSENFLNNNFKLVKYLTLLTILSDYVDYVGEFLNNKLRALRHSTVN